MRTGIESRYFICVMSRRQPQPNFNGTRTGICIFTKSTLMTVLFPAMSLVWVSCQSPQTSECVLSNGLMGPCCVLELPGGIAKRGICRSGDCTDGTIVLRNDKCGSAPDATVVLDTDSLPSDSAPPDGPPIILDGDLDDGSLACEGLSCSSQEICVDTYRRCVPRNFGLPGGSCLTTRDCRVGVCERFPGVDVGQFGQCHVLCSDSDNCQGGVCVIERGANVCRRRCSRDQQCAEDWFCHEAARQNGGVCEPDCRRLGCPGQRRCEVSSGLCVVPQLRCRYPCRVGESCTSGRCVRNDGTCLTDYHCSLDDFCFRGTCVRTGDVSCLSVDDCSDSQRCLPTFDGMGECAVLCTSDQDCPIHRICNSEYRACLPRTCGSGTNNGSIYQVCSMTAANRSDGTCLPAALHDGVPGGLSRYCHESGSAQRGHACDAQVRGRDLDSLSLRCEPRTLCFGDPDDPLEPIQQSRGRGICRAVCWPDGQECESGLACVRVAPPDDPITADVDGYDLALCLPADCTLFGALCDGGTVCQPFGLWSQVGSCRQSGPRTNGQSCERNADCEESALCLSDLNGRQCMALCDPDNPSCLSGVCYSEPAWAYGICLN